MIYVAIMGYGTIGSGVAEVLEKNCVEVAKGAGKEIAVKYVLDLREFPDSPIADKLIHDFSILLNDPEVSIVVEAMGGVNPAYQFVKACLEAGKHVVTPNKALVAAHGTELMQIAKAHHVSFLFEASVGGGIPIIRPMYRCLKGEKIEAITGILNGTTNYILTKMDKEGSSFEAALKEAQELGYAERNPEADVEGHDTCRKLAILTAMATGKEVNYEDIYTEGITKITDMDFRYAEKMGASIKLLGASRISGEAIHAWVAPVMIGKKHPLYAVNDVFNGILLTGNMLGNAMFYGSGAGKLPTASAVVADIMEAAEYDTHIEVGWSEERLQVADMKTSVHQYFVRMAGHAAEQEEKLRTVFGDYSVIELDGADEFAVLTCGMQETEFQKSIEKLDCVLQTIRAELQA